VYGKTLEATEGTIKNEQSRDNDNIGYTRHRNEDRHNYEKNYTQSTAQKTKKKDQHDPHKKLG
jgi:hypothetical protein